MEPEHDDEDDDFLRAVASVADVVPPPADALRPCPGDRLGHFEVVAPIGRGGMGVVYLARDVRLGRQVALKLLPPSFAADVVRRERLLREARAAAALSHPNLVAIHEVGEHGGAVYLVLEYVAGETLRARLDAGPLAIDEALELGRGILAGLAHVHAAGLLHRDLKPENVLVGLDGRPRLLDFGLAKIEGDSDPTESRLTRDGVVLGTPGYMAPEQARGLSADGRADVFAFGALLYEMLAGVRAFEGATTADVVSAVLRDEPRPVDELRPEVSPDIAAVVGRCLRKAPSDRFACTVDVLAALDDAARTPSRPPSRRRRLWRAGLLLAGAAAVAMVGGAVWHRRSAASGAAASAAMASAAPPAPTAMTAVPLPTSASPAAVAAYAQGLQAFRDGDWDQASVRFREAITADPGLAAAHLRLAIMLDGDDLDPAGVRSVFTRAMNARARLSPRDQAIADAIEPMIDGEPGDVVLTRMRLRALVNASPADAELHHLVALFGAYGTPEGVQAEETAVALDPSFADAWQILAGQRALSGDVPGALAALDRCVTVAPWSRDCRGERARIFSASGQCERAEEELRRSLGTSSELPSVWHDARANALFALGRDEETVLEVFRQKWALAPESRRAGVTAYDQARLAAARGRFEEALAALKRGEAAIDRDVNLVSHSRNTSLRVAILRELGRDAEAAVAAERYLQRRDVWVARSYHFDASVPMLRALARAGKISRDELVRRRDAWLARVGERVGGTPTEPNEQFRAISVWTNAFSTGIDSREDALAAIAVMNDYTGRSGALCGLDARISGLGAGIVYALAGRPADAIAPLERAVHRCDWLEDPITTTEGMLRLGESYEATHDTASACGAYREVMERWAAAPASLRRDAASAGYARLRCATLAGGARRPGHGEAGAVAVDRSSTCSAAASPVSVACSPSSASSPGAFVCTTRVGSGTVATKPKPHFGAPHPPTPPDPHADDDDAEVE